MLALSRPAFTIRWLFRFQHDGLTRALVVLPVWVFGAALVL
ncbi:hypothetical protein [Streptomyces griseoluteus]